MKEEAATANKATFLHPPIVARPRAASKINVNQDRNGESPANSNQKARRSPGLNRSKASEDRATLKGREMEDRKLISRPENRAVEQFARLPRRFDSTCKRIEDDAEEKRKELQERLDKSENLVNELQSEISMLKTQVEKLKGRNSELESQNKKLKEDLAVAEAKISNDSSHDQLKSSAAEVQPSKFREVQQLIASRLENFKVNEVVKEKAAAKVQPPVSKLATCIAETQTIALINGPPPPPAPPLPRKAPAKAASMQRAPALVQFYHSLTKQDGKKGTVGNGRTGNYVANAHSSIVGEIRNRSAHLLAIKQDIETKGDMINDLIRKVQDAAYMDIEDVLSFVEWLDKELSSLADERAVLKHFNWPERKADAMREAAFEYRGIKQLHAEILSHGDDFSISCEAALRKISSLLDKSERCIDRLIKLRDATMTAYKNCKIPTDWMLDSGMVSKIKLASVKLAKLYMKRVSTEIESLRLPEKEFIQEALLMQSVRFAYRAHQFAGGLDSETMCAFEDLRRRVSTQATGSRDLLAGIARG